MRTSRSGVLLVNEISPVEFGKLIANMTNLTEKLDETSAHVDALNQRMGELEGRWKLGKAGIAGLTLGVGFSLWGVKDTLQKLLDWLSP